MFSNERINLFNTYALLIIAGTVKYIPFASRSSLNSMLQLSNEIEEAAIIHGIPWYKIMLRIIIPIQKSSIISGYLLPFMTCLRELSLFMLLCTQGFIVATTLDYFDEMGLYAFSSAINLILIIMILISNSLVNKITGASLDKGIGGIKMPDIKLTNVTRDGENFMRLIISILSMKITHLSLCSVRRLWKNYDASYDCRLRDTASGRITIGDKVVFDSERG